MNIQPPPDTNESRAIAEQATAEIARKFQARKRIPAGWLGYNTMGRIGWTIVLPAMLATMLGHWLDNHHPAGFSWMLALLVVTVVLGSANAIYWAAVSKRAAPDSPQ